MIDQLRSEVELVRLRLFEDTRMELNLKMSQKILEDIKAGRPADPKLIDLSGMKERYLEALLSYGSWGLTAEELFEKRLAWLLRPTDMVRKDAHLKVPERRETVSMFLNRLNRQGLADRIRVGHTYRYFLTESGSNRLIWYMKGGKKGRAAIDKWLAPKFWENWQIITEIKNRHISIEAFLSSPKASLRDVYNLMWKGMEDLLNASLNVQLSLFNFTKEDTIKYAVSDMTRSLQELQHKQITLFSLL